MKILRRQKADAATKNPIEKKKEYHRGIILIQLILR
jgi:hypothetical protein